MTEATAIQLADYQPFSHIVQNVDLTFRLGPKATRVTAILHLATNPARPGPNDLRLDGENLTLIRAVLNGQPLSLIPDATGLTIPHAALPTTPFTLETEVEIAPEGNTALEGLYMSNGLYCTQCEAEGFRKITFYPDRPDVMAPFKVRIECDLPILLSNGNPITSGAGFAEWQDP
ncbi:MAG: aminopeptidase N, partial [Paracoccaceae bacterium]